MFAAPENTNADPTRMHSSRSTSTLLQASARSMVSGRKSSRRVPLGDEILIGQRTGRLYSSRSSAALTDRYISKDKLIQYSPYYAMPDVGIQNKSVLQTSRPGLSRALEKSATFPNQAPLSSRSARRHAGAFLAQSRRRDVVLSELERNRSMMLKAIEEKKLELRRQLHATDRALRVKEQLRTRSTAEGKVVAEQTKGRMISKKTMPVARYNKYGFRSHRDSSGVFHGMGFADRPNYKSQYANDHSMEKNRTARNKLWKQELKIRFPIKEAEFTKVSPLFSNLLSLLQNLLLNIKSVT